MPGLVRKLLVFAAIDGLVLQPISHKGQRPAPAVKIAYKGAAIGPAIGSTPAEGKGFEAFGIVGLLTVSNASYLISITRRQQVAQIQGKPIYVITEVALTPLISATEAESSVLATRAKLLKFSVEGADTDSESEDEGVVSGAASDEIEDEDHTLGKERPQLSHARSSSIAEDVITRKGGYDGFAKSWFSRNGWRNIGLSGGQSQTPVSRKDGEAGKSAVPVVKDGMADAPVEKVDMSDDGVGSLLPKLLKTTNLLFGSSRSFFFSYDYDITRSLGNKRTTSSDVPLYKDVDPLFFWNRHVIAPFIEAGQDSFVLPLLQGFVAQTAFTVDKHPSAPAATVEVIDDMEMKDMSEESEAKIPVPAEGEDGKSSFLITLISRRSVKRAGLRYLRRGVDDDGNTANSVETEQILSTADGVIPSKSYSFLQIRGSIPIFFSQSPYSFKPVPQIQHSPETNYKAFKKHFSNLTSRYGEVQVASLVEKHGNEAIVGDKYEENIKQLQCDMNIGFEWFDFHSMCKGMKFENVNLLLETLNDKLTAFGESVEVDGKLVRKQSGVLRTNCMDCLDRTNVVQSACGRRALELQLKEEGFDLTLQTDQTTQWFNTLWADNGDAISKQYASTAALKGDFTRTRKRNYKGALTDMGLSISRFYSGIIADYFSQAAIDFLVGNVSSLVFSDFEANMMSGDPAISLHRMRQQAIDVSRKLVIADDAEDLISGWAFLTPHEPNTIKSTPFEESVLLLTDAAIYACRFDWNMEKVSSFERVDLRHISKITWGTYVTSTFSPAQCDEERNVGLVITYKAGKNDIQRVNTRSMSTAPARDGDLLQSPLAAIVTDEPPSTTKIMALKALPARTAQGETGISEKESIRQAVGEIERAVLAEQGLEAKKGEGGLVSAESIISLVEARRSTGLLEQLGHSLKKLVWA